MLKRFIRRCLAIRKDETVADGLQRHYLHLEQKIPYKHISKKELRDYLIKLGICRGDVLIVHASWRALYMLDASPIDVIEILLDLLGEEGTLLMPAYGADDKFFDMKKTKSAAGVLSECFRQYPETRRSCFPKFSMCGCGRYADEILSEHSQSEYQFDQHSPYSIATLKYDAKVLLMGMGKKPHKISVFHCASYNSKDQQVYYKKCYSNRKVSNVICSEREREVHYLDRMPGYNNNKRVFKKLFEHVPQKVIHKGRLNLTLFCAKDAYNIALEFCKNGGKIYCK